jgi:uncharacterized integral membrane protein
MREEYDDHKVPAEERAVQRSGRDARTIARLVLWSALAFVLLMLVLQNGDQTDVRFLGWTVSMPRFALILVSAGLGAVIAVLWMLLRGRRGSS